MGAAAGTAGDLRDGRKGAFSAPTETISQYARRAADSAASSEEQAMAKGTEKRKQEKKKPQKTLKEKRADKAAKKI